MRLKQGRASWWIALVWLVAGAVRAWAAQATLVADTHVNSALPAVNSGAISNLNVGGGYTALVQFDLSTLPSGTTATQISRAVLLLYCNRFNAAGTVSVQSVKGAWNEYSVTYATLPVLGSATQTFPVSQAGAYVAVDVTALVQEWVTTPASNNGLALTSGAASVQFDSKENDQTGHAPVLDIAMVNSGPAGPPGATGATGAVGLAGAQGPPGLSGPMGLTGPIGPAGPLGPAGPAGAAGARGLDGVTGSQGPSGPIGLPGPAGPVGMAFQGAYLPTILYEQGDGVLYGGAGYVSLVANNLGHAPDLSPGFWAEFASGSAGPAGPQGPVGPAGPAGPAGVAGVNGAAGLTGAQGPVGLQGPAGPTGAVGPAGPAGSQGSIGPQGPTGAAGPAGAVGMRFRGAWGSGVPYAVSDAVSFGGATYLATTANAAEEPDLFPATWAVLAAQGAVGPSGPSGPTGAAATVSVGAVATGLAGSQAMVTNSGTSSAAVLNFTIPQGAAGANGTGGGGSSSGALPISAYHAVSFSFTFYSLGGTTSSATETAPVLTWMPNACTATTLAVYSQQANAITVRLREGTPGAMADTALVCSVAAAGTCSVTGSVPVAAGSFVDLSVTGADGTASAVWTALGCS